MSNEKMIEIKGVTKSFGDLQVLKGIDLIIYKIGRASCRERV